MWYSVRELAHGEELLRRLLLKAEQLAMPRETSEA